MDYILGIDIGGTHIRYGYVEPSGKLHHFSLGKVERFQTDFVAELAALIADENAQRHCAPRAIAIGFPSTLDRSRRVLVSTPNIAGLDNVPIVELLEAQLHIPVIVDRDVNFLFTYDCFSKKVTGDVILGCYVGTGFGNVISIHNHILYGKNGVAAELGHIPIKGSKAQCSCGNIGCAETIASGKALKRLQETHFPDTAIQEIFIAHPEHPCIQSFVEDLAIPIATEINILDPDAVIIGGGVVQMAGFPKDMLENYVHDFARKPYPAENLSFIYSDSGQENGVVGAALFAYQKLN